MLFTIHLNLKIQNDLRDKHWILVCLQKVKLRKMKLRYLQIETFHRILALELVLNVVQPKLLPWQESFLRDEPAICSCLDTVPCLVEFP